MSDYQYIFGNPLVDLALWAGFLAGLYFYVVVPFFQAFEELGKSFFVFGMWNVRQK